MDLLTSRSDDYINRFVCRRLAQQYGPVDNHGGVFHFHSAMAPPDNVIAAIRDEVIKAFNVEDIKFEVGRRILLVMQDTETQINIHAHCLDIVSRQVAGDKVTKAELADVDMAKQLNDWINAMRAVGRDLSVAPDTTYRNDSHWPVPPTGWQTFVERF